MSSSAQIVAVGTVTAIEEMRAAMTEKERIVAVLETAVGILTPQEREPRTAMDWSNFAASVRAMLNGLMEELSTEKPA
jgi:hypothetical protein